MHHKSVQDVISASDLHGVPQISPECRDEVMVIIGAELNDLLIEAAKHGQTNISYCFGNVYDCEKSMVIDGLRERGYTVSEPIISHIEVSW